MESKDEDGGVEDSEDEAGVPEVLESALGNVVCFTTYTVAGTMNSA